MIELCKDVDALGINNNNVRSCDFSRSERDTRKQVVLGGFRISFGMKFIQLQVSLSEQLFHSSRVYRDAPP